MVRGIERRRIFRQPGDYVDFLKRLGDNLIRSGCRCFAWALMPNHLHLLLLSGIRGIASLMHPLLTGYAVRFNLKYHRVGHLFQNRYKSIICQENPYFLELIRYLALNPVRAGIVRTPEDLTNYPWTSHSAILGRYDRPWLEVDDVLSRFGSTRIESKATYERFVLDGWNQGHQERLEGGGLLRSMGNPDNVLQARRLGESETSDIRILGDGSFVEEILRQAEIEERQNQTIQQTWSKEDLQHLIASRTGIQADALLSTDRRRDLAEARAMLVHAAVDWLGLPGTIVGAWTKLSGAGVSKARARGRQLAEKTQLLQWLKSEKVNSVP